MTETEYAEIIEMMISDMRHELAAEVESDATISRLLKDDTRPEQLRRITMIAKLAARNIRADQTGRLTKARALADARNVEFDDAGDPQVFPFDNASSRVMAAVKNLDPADDSLDARHLRECAASVRDHRASFRNGHTLACRGDLYRGLCH